MSRWGRQPDAYQAAFVGCNRVNADCNQDAQINGLDIEPFISLLTGQFDDGDLNCDAIVNFGDVSPFVLALISADGYAAAYPGCQRTLADVDHSGTVNGQDIQAFVNLLIGN